MTDEEAGEHVLQIAGTQDRPAPGTHIGTLADVPGLRASPSISSPTSASTARREPAR